MNVNICFFGFFFYLGRCSVVRGRRRRRRAAGPSYLEFQRKCGRRQLSWMRSGAQRTDGTGGILCTASGGGRGTRLRVSPPPAKLLLNRYYYYCSLPSFFIIYCAVENVSSQEMGERRGGSCCLRKSRHLSPAAAEPQIGLGDQPGPSYSFFFVCPRVTCTDGRGKEMGGPDGIVLYLLVTREF